MNSLNDLNNFSALEIEYEDQRLPSVIADIFQNNFDVLISQGQQHQVPSNFRVDEVINYQASAPVFRIDLSQVPGATVVFPDIAEGIEWDYITALASTEWGTATVRDIAWNGSIFCAVGDTGKVATSSDGSNWIFRNSIRNSGWGTSGNINAIVWNGSIFCAVGAGGRIATSSNGINWTNQPNLINSGLWNSSQINCIVWTGSNFVIGAIQGRIATSPDGVTWTQRGSLRATTWGTADAVTALAWNGSRICAVGDNGKVATSPEGINWGFINALRTSGWGTTAEVRDIVWNGSIFCAVGDTGKVATSNSALATTWTYQNSLENSEWSTTNARAVVWKDNEFCLVGDLGRVATSPNGVTWTNRNSLRSTGWSTTQCLTVAWNGNQLLTGGADSKIASGATVTLFVSNPSDEVFQVTGFKRSSEFEKIKTARILLPNVYFGEFNYSPTILINDGLDSYSWTVAVTVLEVNALSQPTEFNYISAQSQLITGTPEVVFVGTPEVNWQLTISADYSAVLVSISSAGTGGTASFNSQTKVYTILGTSQQLNSHLSTLSFQAAANVHWDYNFNYSIIDLDTDESDFKSQSFINTQVELLDLVRSPEQYQVNTSANIAGGPQILQISSSINQLYTMEVTSIPTAAVDNMSVVETQGSFGFTTGGITEFGPEEGTQSSPTYFHSVKLDQNGSTRLSSLYFNTFNPQPFKNLIHYRTNTVWSEAVELVPENEFTVWQPAKNSISADGQRIALAASRVNGRNRVIVYVRDQNNWVEESVIIDPVSTGVTGYGNCTALNNTGDRLVVSSPGNLQQTIPGKVYIYSRTGSTWTLTQTLQDQVSVNGDNFGFDIAVNSSASVIAVSRGGGSAVLAAAKGRAIIYRFVQDQWIFNNSLEPDTFSHPYSLDLSNDGDTLLVGNPNYDNDPEDPAGPQGSHYVYYYTDNWTMVSFFTPTSRFVTNYAAKGSISISGDGKVVIIGADALSTVFVFYEFANGWNLARTFNIANYPAMAFIGKGVAISKNGNILEIAPRAVRYEVNSDNTVSYYYGSATLFRNSAFWDESQSTLYISGSKQSINAAIDNIVMTPAAEFDQDFVLKYQVTTALNEIASRIQPVIKD